MLDAEEKKELVRMFEEIIVASKVGTATTVEVKLTPRQFMALVSLSMTLKGITPERVEIKRVEIKGESC